MVPRFTPRQMQCFIGAELGCNPMIFHEDSLLRWIGMYSISLQTDETRVYYVRSEDRVMVRAGMVRSDILLMYSDGLNFEIDGTGMHAVWF
jgi:hypothetical protein